MKTFGIIFIIFAVYAEVKALKCYICDSTFHGSSCYDPLNYSNIQAMDCKDVYYQYQRSEHSPASGDNPQSNTFDFKQPEKLQEWNPNLNPRWNPNIYSRPTEFECVQYEKLDNRGNRRIFVRGCQGKNQSPNFCGEMANLGNYQGYKLTKCDVCYNDYCNKSGSIKLSLLLNLAFFLLFYRCTEF